MLRDLRVQVTPDPLSVPAADRAFDLLAALALADIVAQACLLLTRTILAIADGDRRSVSVARARGNRLVRRLLSLRMWSLKPITVVLATISHSEGLTLELSATNDLWLAIAYEL